MLQQMQTMMETMQSMNINNDGGSSSHGGKNQQNGCWNHNTSNNGNRGYQGNCNRYQNNNGNSNNGNNNSSQNGHIVKTNNQTDYCWTHGLFAHQGTACRTPADDHQTTATRTNRMGGSGRNL